MSDADSSDERARPQYGEYATPDEVAAARGPLPKAPAEPRRVVPDRSLSAPGAGSAAPIPSARPRPRPANNLITALLLVVGSWNTVSSIPSYLDFGQVLTQGVAVAGYGTVTFGQTAHTAGIVLLAVSFLLLIAAIGVSLWLIRRGRRSVWVPVVAAAVYLAASIVVMTVVVANTPALLDVLQNH